MNSAKIAASEMTNSNAHPAFPEKLDTIAFSHNLEFGFIAHVMACTYVEACLNTMCRALFNSTPEDLRKESVKDKIEKIIGSHFFLDSYNQTSHSKVKTNQNRLNHARHHGCVSRQ